MNQRYEIRAESNAGLWTRISVFVDNADLKQPKRLSSIGGRPLALLDSDIRGIFRDGGCGRFRPSDTLSNHTIDVSEAVAARVVLISRLVSTVRSELRVMELSHGVCEMTTVEALYWFGAAMFRYKPARGFAALRILLTTE